jgi:hypothetical protein
VTASYDAGVLTLRVAGAIASAPAQQIAITTAPVEPAEPTVDGAGDAEKDAPQES